MSQFKPAWWLRNPHLQTLWPTLFRRSHRQLNFKPERLEMHDGDFIDLAWVGENQTAPIVLILHGLEGSVHSPYAGGMLHAIERMNWRGVLMHFRGCSGEHNRLARSYHSGETTDVAEVVQYIQRKNPHVPLFAVGYSLGGNVLLKWLGESGKDNPLTAAVAVSVPFQLDKAVVRIQQGFSRVYQRHLLRNLQQRVGDKFAQTQCPISLPAMASLKSLYDFDDKVTAPLHGFQNADDYYIRSSSRQFLRHIQVPTLIVQAQDDPFMTHDIIPESHELSEKIILEITANGGHVGFISGKFPWRARYWLEERVPEFLLSVIPSVARDLPGDPSSLRDSG